MKNRSFVNRGHCFETILPSFKEFFESSLLTDLTVVCHDGVVKTHRLLLASLSNYVRELLLENEDNIDMLILPDFKSQEIFQLYECLLNHDAAVESFLNLAELLEAFGMRLQPFLEKSYEPLKNTELKTLYECENCDKKYSHHQSFLKHCESHKTKPSQLRPDIECKTPEAEVSVCRPKRASVRPKKFENSVLDLDSQRECERDLHTCNICKLQFRSEEDLAKHSSDGSCKSEKGFLFESAITKHRKKKRKNVEFSCTECLKPFSSKQALSNHELLHKNERNYNCEICDKKFVAAGALHNHKKLTHGSNLEESKILQCKFCPKSFNNASNFQRHMRALHFEYSDKKKFVCDVCEKDFKDPSALSAHKKIHSSVKPFQCKECCKKFVTAAQLRVHARIHAGFRPFVCSDCGDRSFTTKGQLNSHILHRHVGVKLSKNHLCTECGASFVKSHDLSVHMLKHTGDLPYKCDQCERGFRSSRNLKNHSRTHTGEKPYRCDTCGRSFGATGGLRQHFLRSEPCRQNASEGAYSMKKDPQVELVQIDASELVNQGAAGEFQTVVLVSQDGADASHGLISMADAASLAASGFAFVELPANVQITDSDTAIVLQTDIQTT